MVSGCGHPRICDDPSCGPGLGAPKCNKCDSGDLCNGPGGNGGGSTPQAVNGGKNNGSVAMGAGILMVIMVVAASLFNLSVACDR